MVVAHEDDLETDRGDTAARQTYRERHGNHGGDRGWDGGVEEDSRPKLVPGAMLTLSHQAAEATMAFTEEVRVLSLPLLYKSCNLSCFAVSRVFVEIF